MLALSNSDRMHFQGFCLRFLAIRFSNKYIFKKGLNIFLYFILYYCDNMR